MSDKSGETCRVSLDALLRSVIVEESDGQKISSLQRSTDRTGEHEAVAGSIILLSLYSIFRPESRHEIFLLLGRCGTEPATYERLGMATRMISYDKIAEESLLPEARPFEWLRAPCGPEGATVGDFEQLQLRII